MSTEKGFWITTKTGKKVFISGDKVNITTKRSQAKKEDAEDRKEKQIEYNRKEADERNKEKSGKYVIRTPKQDDSKYGNSSKWYQEQKEREEHMKRGEQLIKGKWYKIYRKDKNKGK